MRLHSLVLLAALAYASPVLADLLPVSGKGIALLNQGRALDSERKFAQAMENFRAAALADPKASSPLSSIADLYRRLAIGNPDPKEAGKLRVLARDAAHAALKLDERDTTAMETLRLLADGKQQVRYEASPEAMQVMRAAEVLFHEGKYAAAIEQFELASKLVPGYAEAILFVGDCYFMLDDMARAEQKFRQALQMNPLDGTGWRFLFDALIRQGKLKEAEAAALSAIAALPSVKASWMRMAQVLEHGGRKLTPFVMTPGTTLRAADSPASKPAAPFAWMLAAWQATLRPLADMGPSRIKDPGLQDMLRFHQAGQLQAAIFLLQYQEQYRAEFEAWKKAEPDAIKHFIDTFHVSL